MQHSYKILYFDLLPPPPFLREANKVVTCSCFLLILLASFWSIGVFPKDPLSGVVADTLLVGTGLMEVWYLGILLTSTWRLRHYKKIAHELPWQIYELLYPWIGLLLINSTILWSVLVSHYTSSSYFRENLYKALITELVPLVAAEVPILKNWLPKFEPRRFFQIFKQGLSILVGRELGTTIEQHARNVVEFQVDYLDYLQDERSIGTGHGSDQLMLYYDGEKLKLFQSTLSCVYESSRHIGRRLAPDLAGRSWTMLDVGCGEGIFTSHLLAHLATLPQVITALDPSPINVAAYRARISMSYPSILNIDAGIGTIEGQIDDLPTANLVLASHSLYALLDQNRRSAASVLSALLSKTRDGLVVIIMSSRDSYLYSIKKRVLNELHRLDKSSFAEDIVEFFPPSLIYTTETIDTYVDVTSLLTDFDCLLGWLAYFCRVDVSDLRPHFDMCQGVVRDTAIEVSCLPASEQARLLQNEAARQMNLTIRSKIIYHKETVFTIPSKSRIERQPRLDKEGVDRMITV